MIIAWRDAEGRVFMKAPSKAPVEPSSKILFELLHTVTITKRNQPLRQPAPNNVLYPAPATLVPMGLFSRLFLSSCCLGGRVIALELATISFEFHTRGISTCMSIVKSPGIYMYPLTTYRTSRVNQSQ